LERVEEGMRIENVTRLRVRYSETDQMGTFYNSRALEWFECGRTELLRQLGIPYAQMEPGHGVEPERAEQPPLQLVNQPIGPSVKWRSTVVQLTN
jgi:hypothetical protein